MGPLSAWVGRAGAATRRNLADSEGQQGITNLEVSGRFTARGLGRETAGVSFHTAEVGAVDAVYSAATEPLGDQSFGDLGLPFQLPESRFLVHAGP
jgi:hypothetical protein